MRYAKLLALFPLFWSMIAFAQGATESSGAVTEDNILLSGTVPSWIHKGEKVKAVDGQKRVAITRLSSLEKRIRTPATHRRPDHSGEPTLRAVFDAGAFPRSILPECH